MAAQKAYLLFFFLNLLFFFCFCFCLFFDVLFVASLDLKVPMFPANQEEVMLFDGLT